MRLSSLSKLMIMLVLINAVILSGCVMVGPETGTAVEGIATQMELEEEVLAAIYGYEEAFEAGDVDRLMEFYAEEVVSLPPGFPKVEGKETLETDLQGFFDEFTLDRNFEVVDLEVTGNTATRLMEWTNTWTPKAGGEPIIEVGRCMLGYEKIDDEWLVTWEIWNTEEVTEGEPVDEEAATAQMELEEEVLAAIYGYEEAFEAGDVDRLMEFYAEEVVSLPPGFPKVEGKETLETDLQGFFDEFTLDRDFEVVDLEVSGNTATRLMEWTNTWTPKAGGEPIIEVGRCMLGYEKIDDEWLVTWEIWNTEEVTEGEPVDVDAATAQMELEEEVLAAIYGYEEAFEAGDVDRLMEFYAQDVVSLPPGFPKIEGKEALEADLRGFFDEYTLDRDFEVVDLEVSGDTATRLMEWTNTWTPKAGGEPISEVGRCKLGYEKIDDEWLVTWEIWNTYE